MQCPVCKTYYLNSNKFCPECGTRLVLICNACGRANQPLGKNCGSCGRRLEKDPGIPTRGSTIESERKNATVLFSDLSGYTALTAKLDPEELKEITNHIFSNVSRIIVKYGGFVERVLGDEVLAFFGVPKSNEDHPLNAILAAKEIHYAVKTMSIGLEKKTGQALRMHTGIDTGLVVTGVTDVAKGHDGFSGRAINTASRLANVAGPDEILIGADTYKKARRRIIAEPLTPEVAGLNNYETEIYHIVDGRKTLSGFDPNPEQTMTPFVGRKRELAQLEQSFKQSLTGRPMAVAIVSKPGEGKSRLLYEFRKRIGNPQLAYLEGRCFSFHSNTAFFPLVLLLKQYFGIRDADEHLILGQKLIKGLAQLGQSDASTTSCIFRLLSVQDSMTDEVQFNSDDLKENLAQVLRQMIINGSKKRSVIIAIEDLQWIDKSSEEQLEFLLKNLDDTKVFFIFTYRQEYVPPWYGKLRIADIKLRGLNRRSSLTMVRRLLGIKRIRSNLSALILDNSRGVPLFIEEYVRSLVDGKKIKIKGVTGYLEGDRRGLEVPATIKDIISARIDALPKRLKEVLQTGSVAGKIFSPELMRRVTGLPEEDLLISLSALVEHQFLYSAEFGGQVQYHFKHVLISEVAYSNLLVSRRKEIHYKFAEAIEKYYNRKLDQYYEVLSYHFSNSADRGKAYRYLMLSGKKATLNYSNREALDFFKSAAGVPDEADIKLKIEALKQTIIPMIRLGYPENSLEILKRGVDLSKMAGDSGSLAKFYDMIGNYYTAKGGNPLLGIKYSEKCLKEVEKIRDPELIARVTRGLCGSYIVTGEPLKSVKLVRKAIDLLGQPGGKPGRLVGALPILPVLKALLAHSLGWLGDFKAGSKWAETAAVEGENLGNLYDQAYIHFLCGYLYMHSGDGEKIIEHFTRCINCCEEGKVILWLGLGWTGLGMGYFFSGDLDAAGKLISKGKEMQKGSKIPYYLSFHLLAQGLVSYESNELARARIFFENSLKMSEKFNETWVEGLSKIFLGSIYSKQADRPYSVGQAEALIREGLKILEGRKILPWVSVGLLILGKFYARSQPAEAAARLGKAGVLFEKMGMKYWLNRTRETLKCLDHKAS